MYRVFVVITNVGGDISSQRNYEVHLMRKDKCLRKVYNKLPISLQ